MNRILSEPALIAGAIQAALGLLLAFGAPMTDEQVGAIMAVTAAFLALVVRAVVTPTHKHPAKRRRIDLDNLTEG